MEEKKKYEVLPGVEIPDINKIREAASDFSVSEVGSVDIKTISYDSSRSYSGTADALISAELEQLHELGVKVAEDEAKAQAESRAKMDKIMHSAVHASESLSDLKFSVAAKADDEKRKALEESMKAEQEQKAEEEAKNKAREERRQLQLRMVEESRERAAKEKAEREAKEAEEKAAAEKKAAEEKAEAEKRAAEEKAEAEKRALEEAKAAEEKRAAEEKAAAEKKAAEEAKAAEEKASAEKKAQVPVWEKPVENTSSKKAKMATTEETFDDFKEFL